MLRNLCVIVVAIAIVIGATAMGERFNDFVFADDDDERESRRRTTWRQLQEGVWLVHRASVSPEEVAKYGLRTNCAECPPVPPPVICPDQIPPIRECDIQVLLDNLQGATLTHYSVYGLPDGRFYLIPAWANTPPPTEPPTEPPPPEPPPGPAWEANAVNFNPLSCVVCHDKPDDKYKPGGYIDNPGKLATLHDRSKHKSAGCEACHIRE